MNVGSARLGVQGLRCATEPEASSVSVCSVDVAGVLPLLDGAAPQRVVCRLVGVRDERRGVSASASARYSAGRIGTI